MNKPPYQPTVQQMQAQAQAALLAQQQAYLQQMTMYPPTSQPMGAANGRHRYTSTTTSSSSTGPAYITYVGTGGTIYYTTAINTDTQPALAIEEAGIRAGEITGVRAWLVVGDHLLKSMYMDYIWQPGAQKITDERVHPLMGNGFHAFKTLEQCRHEYCGDNVIYGEVALWGEVYEHERGYRAECARITRFITIWEYKPTGLRRLWENLRKNPTLEALRRKYGVEE